jgi:hypothetical protein
MKHKNDWALVLKHEGKPADIYATFSNEKKAKKYKEDHGYAQLEIEQVDRTPHNPSLSLEELGWIVPIPRSRKKRLKG